MLYNFKHTCTQQGFPYMAHLGILATNVIVVRPSFPPLEISCEPLEYHLCNQHQKTVSHIASFWFLPMTLPTEPVATQGSWKGASLNIEWKSKFSKFLKSVLWFQVITSLHSSSSCKLSRHLSPSPSLMPSVLPFKYYAKP